ncbi:MAG: hypothetical protein JO331_03820, partial [Verrucomicrobia bacterium]|nr:hypothetical protein [Verrucomicrobiota bacterium]
MSQKPEKEHRKRRPWLRYFGLGCLLLILLLAALYRPILFGIAQFAGQQFARSEHLALQFKLRGSVFTNLYIEDLTLRPLPENTSFPVTNLTLGQVGLRYHPLKLLQQDWEHVIELVAVHDLDLTLRPTSAEASVGKPAPTTSPGGLP